MRPTLEHEFELSYIQAMDSHRISLIEIQMQRLRQEISFQQTVFEFFQIFVYLRNFRTVAEVEADRIEEAVKDSDIRDLQRWDLVLSDCLDIEKLGDDGYDFKDFCLEMLDRCLHRKTSKCQNNPGFILCELGMLKILMISKSNVMAHVKKQIRCLEKMLEFVFVISRAAERSEINEELRKFLEYIQPWVDMAAAVPFLLWVDEMDEKVYALLSSFLDKFNPSTPKLVEVYLGAIKGLKALGELKESNILLMRNALWRFIDIVLENLIVQSDDDRFEMLTEGLIFLTTVLMDPPQIYTENENSILRQTHFHVGDAAYLIWSLCSGKLRDAIAWRREALLQDSQEKIEGLKAELRQLRLSIPGLLEQNNVPQTNKRGFFYFLLRNLKKKLEDEVDLFPFEKHLIGMIQKELVSLRPFLQDEHEGIEDILAQASSVAYLVDHVTDLCLCIDVPIWSNMIHLYNAAEQILSIKTEVTKRGKDQMYNNRDCAKISSKLIISGQEQSNATTKDGVKVGFTDEEKKAIDQLTGGVEKLHIIAILGMPGQGKTTLARRVFHDSCVQRHFISCAWSCVSQAYDIKEILLDILKGVREPVPREQVSSITWEDLAEKLYKCLKGRRYLIILDDMWDSKVWQKLHLSFPDDNNGSRILLTSRIHNVALEIRRDCCIIKLHPFSLEESWNLLQMRVFEEDSCPEILSSIGNMIAENCGGLPLAIVLIAGLLKKNKDVDSWRLIAESLKSHIASDGWCMNILELSYRHLPDFLKPCFLYLGIFQEDERIDAKKLIQLWISEGFVQNDGRKRLEVVANEYLIDLVGRSLVSVTKRSSRYGIKKCHVHDLLHEFCLIKAKDERFLLVPNVSNHSSSTSYGLDFYRLCVLDKSVLFVDSKPIVRGARSLLLSVSPQEKFVFNTPSFFTRFKLLRVLDLESVALKSGLGEITHLVYLQFLSVFCTFSSIPPSIINLLRLEVIRLRNNLNEGYLPSVLMKMANLRHIMVHGKYRLNIMNDDDEEHWLPLGNLETFTFLYFDDAISFESLAWKLPNVQKLGLQLNFSVNLASYFNRLESLNLEIIEDICPSTFKFPSTLKKLSLKSWKPLLGITISSIGRLSSLEVLKLQVHFEDQRWEVEDDEFLNLRYLKIRRSGIKEWNAFDGSFPCLEQLVVKSCYVLEELPCSFGDISTLKRIKVHDCNESVTSSYQQIIDNQKDYGNEGLQCSISYHLGWRRDVSFGPGALLISKNENTDHVQNILREHSGGRRRPPERNSKMKRLLPFLFLVIPAVLSYFSNRD